MKKMDKLSAAVFAFALVCLGTSLSAGAAAKKNVFSQSMDYMEAGTSCIFKAEVENGKEKKTVWKSSDEKVLKVSSTGKVKAKAAGTAVVTATVGKKSVTKEVTVYPSLKDISTANNAALNLEKEIYSSVTATVQNGGYTFKEIVAKGQNGEYMTAFDDKNKSEIHKGNLKYSYDKKSGQVVIYAARNITSGGISCPYEVFSSEEITSVKEEGENYRIFTSSDVSEMTKEEQSDIGITEGVIQKELVVDNKTGLLKEYIHTILFDSENPDFKSVSSQVFSYNEDSSETVPEAVNLAMNAKNKRNVTIIAYPGTKQEKKSVYTLPDTMPLYIACNGTVFYKNAACTEEFTQAVKNADGTYQSYTLYVK